MSSILQALETIANYYGTNRQVGHTTAMLQGAANTRPMPLVLVHSQEYQPVKGAVHISVHNILALKGRTQALAIDHRCLEVLFREAARRIQNLEMVIAHQEHAANLAMAKKVEDMNALEHLLVATQERLKLTRTKKRRSVKGTKAP